MSGTQQRIAASLCGVSDTWWSKTEFQVPFLMPEIPLLQSQGSLGNGKVTTERSNSLAGARGPGKDVKTRGHTLSQTEGHSFIHIPGLRDRQRDSMTGFMEFAPKREVKMSVYLRWQFRAGKMAQ